MGTRRARRQAHRGREQHRLLEWRARPLARRRRAAQPEQLGARDPAAQWRAPHRPDVLRPCRRALRGHWLGTRV